MTHPTILFTISPLAPLARLLAQHLVVQLAAAFSGSFR
jgi:hypothetical protein